MRFHRSNPRRDEVHRSRPDVPPRLLARLRAAGARGSVIIAFVFLVIVSAILMLREDVVSYRPGQYVAQDIISRVDFAYHDSELLHRYRQQARDRVAHVYKPNGDVWGDLEAKLRQLPDEVAGKSLDDLPDTLKKQFELQTPSITTALDSGAVTALDQFNADNRRKDYNAAIKAYVDSLRGLVILPSDQREAEMHRQEDLFLGPMRIDVDGVGQVEIDHTFADEPSDALLAQFKQSAVANFRQELQLKIVAFTMNNLAPTDVLDAAATTDRQNAAAAAVPSSRGDVIYRANQPIKDKKTPISQKDWDVLQAEHTAFLDSLSPLTQIESKIGIVLWAALVTITLCAYVYRYQPRIVKNNMRAFAIASLLVLMLLLAQLAGIGSGPIYLFGTAPTILVAMILAIAYDQRFAFGVASVHAILVTAALDQGIGFFFVLFVGVLCCCFLLNDVRTRSKLIEVGGITALAMMVATGASLSISLTPVEPPSVIGISALYAGAAGLIVGFLVLGILPFVEKAFRITTSMTLLELADASHPLFRRLHAEAPGTYNHSLQVATLAESAAGAIGANSLLCRVGAYYHDIGKINKPDYFIENQTDGVNRHLNLSPSVSLLIITGHVKYGIELAREYKLPTSLMPFIQQHHGTTLVEYFYHEARKRQEGDATAEVTEEQFRYPGPRPRTREVAILMLADAVESATRCLTEFSPGKLDDLVRDLAMKRLLD
ncbi:MAG TPA: HDIG domain-containing protein, partial [Tepidisphaeraceae bacterium]|nr:HDIG domain-containing protein [Tepidisphaeraceae bacterium]